MRVLRIAFLCWLIGLFFMGCTTSGVGSRPGEAFTPTPSALDSISTPTPTPAPAGATPKAPRAGPSPTQSRRADVFRPKPLPGGFTVAPNWLVFQPAKGSSQPFELENFVWLTDGQRWLGPFPFYPRSISVDFVMIRQDGAWKACWQEGEALPPSCVASLPGEPPERRKVLEVECAWLIMQEAAQCDLPPGMPASRVQIPNPFQGLEEPCSDCWQFIRILALEGDSTVLAIVSRHGGLKLPPYLYVLGPGEASRALLPPEERKGGMLAVQGFAPDGRFLLIDDFSETDDMHTTWIVRWPQGDRVSFSWPGRIRWVEPRPERSSQ